MRAASPWIQRFAPLVGKGGSVLDLACGSGRHTRLFLAAGHPVWAIDRDLSQVSDLEGEPGLTLLETDLETDLEGEPAVWPIGERRFQAVVVTNYLWRPLLPEILAAVDAGGILLYETFAVGNERYGKPSKPDFLLRPDELLELCRGELDVIAFEQGIETAADRQKVVQRICARRASASAAQPSALPR